MARTASKVLEWCRKQLGVMEKPAGSNIVRYWDTYRQRTGADYSGEPWCAAFVSAAEWYGGVEPWASARGDAGFLRYCPSMVTKAQALGIWKGRISAPKPGDVAIFASGSLACHVGIVEKRIEGKRIQTIEGNTSAGDNANGGQVQRRLRDFGEVGSSWYILGFIRPKYAKEPETTPTHRITASALNVRSRPTVSSGVARILRSGDLVEVTESKAYRNGNIWGRVDGGWIALRYKGCDYAEEV